MSDIKEIKLVDVKNNSNIVNNLNSPVVPLGDIIIGGVKVKLHEKV